MKRVVVAEFFSEIDLSLMRNQLENIGISTFVQNEHMANLREFSSGSKNGIQLLVEEKDYPQAMNFLIEKGHYKAEDFEPTWLEKLLQKWFGKSKK